MYLNKLLDPLFSESERKSWNPEDFTTYEIYFQRDGEWFSRAFRQQSDKYPRGITREKAKTVAGKTGRIYKTVYHRERIQ